MNSSLFAQEKLTISYGSVDAPSANWYIAREKGFYKKYGMDVESTFIPASSINVAVLVAGQIKFSKCTGGVIASAAVSGANLSIARLVERVPLVSREGMDIQLKEALARQPGVNLKVDDIIDDSIVTELEKEGFIDKVFKP